MTSHLRVAGVVLAMAVAMPWTLASPAGQGQTTAARPFTQAGREPNGTGSLLQPGWAAHAPLAAGIVLADGRRGQVEVAMHDARDWSGDEAALLEALAWLTVAAIENGRLLSDARPEAAVEAALHAVRSR